MKEKRIFGLIGKSLEHSFSPAYFAKKFESESILDSNYILIPLARIQEFKSHDWTKYHGLNVTLPYKNAIIPYLDSLNTISSQVNAVNTIQIKDGNLIGYNTDVIGFEKSLSSFIQNVKNIKALVLGSGGASKAVGFVLNKLGVAFNIVSRSKGDLQYSELSKSVISEHLLLINCTPLGMFPSVEKYPPIPYDFLTENHYLYDLIYNPEKTVFLKKGESKRARIKNGIEMLDIQAEASWEIWNKE